MSITNRSSALRSYDSGKPLRASSPRRSSSALGWRNPSVVTSATDGCSGQCASICWSTRAVVDLPTATEPASPTTNGVRGGCGWLRNSSCARCRAPAPPTYRLSRRDSGRYTCCTSSRSSSSPSPRTLSISSAVNGCSVAAPRAAHASRSSSTYGPGSRSPLPEAMRGILAGAGRPDRTGSAGTVADMCGIVGYVGAQQAEGVVIEGLRRLEYRGYDSAGVALVRDGQIAARKRAGKLANLDKALADDPLPESSTGIGHTRWATHGAPNDRNAHPHLGGKGRVALVHNGIIENFAALRAELERTGHELVSETDTEIAAHLVERALEDGGTLTDAMQEVSSRLAGAFTLVAVDAQDPGRVVAARRNSPLVVGVGDGENFVASDVAAFIEHTREALELGQNQVVTITRDSVEVTDFDGKPAEARPYHVDWDLSAAEKGGFDWFMRKEIHEQPRAIADSMLGRHDSSGALQLDELRISEDELRGVDKIILIGCGTAFYAGMVAKYAIEHWTRIPCEVELSHEFRYRDPILTRDTLVVAISQSGETADTLMAIRHAREQRSKVLAICNTNGSTIPRESDAVIYTHAGPEIGVASTKGFITQLVASYLLGLYLAQVRGTKFGDEIRTVLIELERMPGHVQAILDRKDAIYALAAELADAR